ncbi:hypothetical protein [Advenella mimigardefordensis]|uniref:hypothetical protein n=1 Tax=Advenella mimigardefordensis TaxID=302406 RepID=UPI0004B99204|nr:hypothetical protein [Advenella mimigardefordensis]
MTKTASRLQRLISAVGRHVCRATCSGATGCLGIARNALASLATRCNAHFDRSLKFIHLAVALRLKLPDGQ